MCKWNQRMKIAYSLLLTFSLYVALIYYIYNNTTCRIIFYLGVIIFVGLTAYDTQKIKQLAYACHMEDEETRNKVALLGAITLYLDFINLFLYILRIFGKRK